MLEKGFYTAPEAIARLATADISESTFYRWVREGVIEKRLPPGRKRKALYPMKQIEDIINQEKLITNDTKVEEEHVGATDWIQSSDLPYVLALDYEMYGPEDTVDFSITRTWWEKNPYMCRILFDANNRQHIWGAFTIIPMQEKTIFRLLRHEITERQITANDILTYEPYHSYSGYIASTTVRPEYRRHLRTLIQSVLHFWCEQYPTIQLQRLYAYASSIEGANMVKHLFFAPRYDIGEDAFELNLRHRNPSPLIQSFQKCVREKEGNQQHTPHIEDKPTRKKLSTTFTKAAKEDMRACVEISQAIFGNVTPLETRLSWLEKNPDLFYVVKSEEQVMGYVSMAPLKPEKIENILKEEEQPSDITPEDIETFAPGKALDIYIMAIAVRPGVSQSEKRAYGARLISGFIETLIELGRKGVVINTLVARSGKTEGIHVLQRLGFTEMLPTVPGKRNFVMKIEESGVATAMKYKEALQESEKAKKAALRK